MNKQAKRRQKRVRMTLRKSGKPRLSVFRTNKHIWAQIIDDLQGKTIVSSSTKALAQQGTKTEKAKKVGEQLAKLGVQAKIKEVVFDRGAYRYHGRVKALAEAAREGGLKF